MPRVIIGAGLGYFFAVFCHALTGGSVYSLTSIPYFFERASGVLVPIFVGAIIGWAWHKIALEQTRNGN